MFAAPFLQLELQGTASVLEEKWSFVNAKRKEFQKRMISSVCHCFQSDAIVIGALVLIGVTSKYTRYDCFFVILAVLITFEQTKSYTATKLWYFSLQKLYFRWIFCGTHLRFFNIFSNVLLLRSKQIFSKNILAIFFKIKSLWTYALYTR